VFQECGHSERCEESLDSRSGSDRRRAEGETRHLHKVGGLQIVGRVPTDAERKEKPDTCTRSEVSR
jgi:hypothetical protein